MIKLKSYAKINLGLQVLNKRKDGFHSINTVFAKIDLADEIIISDNDDLKVHTFPDLGIPEEENLAYKAAKKLATRLHKRESGAEILIKKNIPAGGGLGGGSLNASYSMLGLLDHWNKADRTKEPEIIAPQIGSDVPFFLKKGFAIGKGRGEILDFFELDLPYQILIVNPGIHVNTGAAYKALNRSEKPLPILDYKKLLLRCKDNKSLFREYFVNDFEKSVFAEHKLIAKIKLELYEQGAFYASMSGSGSTLFAFFDPNDDLSELLNYYKDYYVKICKFVK